MNQSRLSKKKALGVYYTAREFPLECEATVVWLDPWFIHTAPLVFKGIPIIFSQPQWDLYGTCWYLTN